MMISESEFFFKHTRRARSIRLHEKAFFVATDVADYRRRARQILQSDARRSTGRIDSTHVFYTL